jgi:hypothetical protein
MIKAIRINDAKKDVYRKVLKNIMAVKLKNG